MNNYSVYELVFPNGKRYIGLTGQKPEDRWQGGSGYCGQFVYKAIKKYGWDNIQHNIISTNLSQNQAARLEEYLIKLYKSNDRKFGYNCSEGGECGCRKSKENHWTYGTPRPKETREKIAKTLEGRYLSKDNPHHSAVIQKDLQGNFIKRWDSMADIKRELGYNHPHISQCCKGTRKTAYGFTWEYA